MRGGGGKIGYLQITAVGGVDEAGVRGSRSGCGWIRRWRFETGPTAVVLVVKMAVGGAGATAVGAGGEDGGGRGWRWLW